MQFGPPRWLPVWALTAGVRVLMRGLQGPELAALMHTVPADLDLTRVEAPFERYRDLRSPTLLLAGAKSPAFLRDANAHLAKVITGCRFELLAGQGHNAPDLTGVAAVARRLTEWFR